MTDFIIEGLKIIAHLAPRELKAEVNDAQWSDFGRRVHNRIVGPDLLEVMTRAGLKSKTTIEMAGYIRAYILTGTKP